MFGCPAFNILLFGAGNAKCVLRHLFGNGGACAYISTFADGNRRNKVAVAADKSVVANSGAVFFLAVIVNHNAAAANIYAAADIGIANIGKMRQLGAVADMRIFNFNKVADFNLVFKHGIRAQM